jgi:hypothetical protein
MTTTHVIFWSGPSSSSSIAAAGDAAAIALLFLSLYRLLLPLFPLEDCPNPISTEPTRRKNMPDAHNVVVCSKRLGAQVIEPNVKENVITPIMTITIPTVAIETIFLLSLSRSISTYVLSRRLS